ncbi:hypothetical protein [Dapis sp. BLCC M172]|uniref:hypothetical protein n=1 Tax=Dapis sp. BLCC M172 TaxID=2975281 RepID=UPI003CF11661
MKKQLFTLSKKLITLILGIILIFGLPMQKSLAACPENLQELQELFDIQLQRS